MWCASSLQLVRVCLWHLSFARSSAKFANTDIIFYAMGSTHIVALSSKVLPMVIKAFSAHPRPFFPKGESNDDATSLVMLLTHFMMLKLTGQRHFGIWSDNVRTCNWCWDHARSTAILTKMGVTENCGPTAVGENVMSICRTSLWRPLFKSMECGLKHRVVYLIQ